MDSVEKGNGKVFHWPVIVFDTERKIIVKKVLLIKEEFRRRLRNWNIFLALETERKMNRIRTDREWFTDKFQGDPK